MAIKRANKLPDNQQPLAFFTKQLEHEQPLTAATAGRLYQLSLALATLKPWNFVGDGEIFLVEDPVSEQTCFCSIMGALGEVLSLHVYIGPDSYRLLRKVLAGKKVSPGEFFAAHRGVSVEFARAPELTPPDRVLLKHFKHPAGKGMMAPIFRALRPGYHPWYVAEPEAVLLARCMHAAVVFCEIVSADPDVDYWQEEDVLPLVVPTGDDGSQQGFAIKIKKMRAPAPRAAPAAPPRLDEARLARILANDYSQQGAVEADYFYTGGVIGKPHQRKAILPIALVTDAESGFLFKPEMGAPAQGQGETLIGAVMSAIESGRRMPREIRVRQSEFKTLLEPLAARLGITVSVLKSLPEIDRAKKALLAMMEGR
jgi:hypothetical protein